ncbi:hypothetical protein ACFOMH_20130 [Paracoccus mangrovi]|uniref:Uncharacterized protein n=2 Tax=Paracoccus TaxID=265 RepID=A0ABV7RC68_9RHOB
MLRGLQKTATVFRQGAGHDHGMDVIGLAEPSPLIIPTQADLEAIYRKQVVRLEALPTGSDQMVAANALLREMLGEVRLLGDPDARDGMLVELRGEASSLFQGVDGT